MKINVTKKKFSLRDTIWIHGIIFSKVYNKNSNDSILKLNSFKSTETIIGYYTCERYSSKGENKINDKRDFVLSVIE